MRIESTPILSKVTCLSFTCFFLSEMMHLRQIHTLTKENVFVLSFFILICFFLLIYMDSHFVDFGKDSITYFYFGKKKTLLYKEIIKIEVNYFHQKIKTIVPVLHIAEKEKEIEIPYGLFENKFEKIHQLIQEKVFR